MSADLKEQFAIEKDSLKSQIKVLADINDKHMERIKELEAKIEERDVKIAYLSRQSGMYDELKKQNEELKNSHEEILSAIKNMKFDNYLKKSELFEDLRVNQKTILEKMGGQPVQVVSEKKEATAEKKKEKETTEKSQKEPAKLEGLKKGDKNRTVEEDKRLKE